MNLPRRGVLGNQDDVPACGTQPCSRIHSRTALDSISNDRVSYFLGDRDTEPPDELGITSFACERQDVASVKLGPSRWTATKSARRRSRISLVMRARQASLLGDRHRDPLAAFGATAAQDFATTTGLLAGAEAMGALTALVMRLIRTLAHGMYSGFAERDRYSPAVRGVKRR